jgi:hypothetical protein
VQKIRGAHAGRGCVDRALVVLHHIGGAILAGLWGNVGFGAQERRTCCSDRVKASVEVFRPGGGRTERIFRQLTLP